MVCLANFHYSLGVVSVPYHKDAINNSCPSWFQGGNNREWLRAKDNGYKMELFSCV
jgi:hypothetical protein